MRNNFKLLCLSFIVLISCADDSTTYTVGEDFIDLESKVIITDTLSLKVSTVQLDSIETSSSNVLLIGSLKDVESGNITTQSFVNLHTSNYSIDNDAVYDSIAVILYYNRYYHGDTTLVQNYKVHEIIETFEPSNDDGDNLFYNTSSLKYDDLAIGELSFTPHPIKKDSIYIPLNSDFGENLFNKIQDNDINNYDDLDKNFKGLTIVPNNNTNTVLGFNKTTMVMRMYYTIDSENDENNEYFNDFTITGSNEFYNKISNDKSGTPLDPITNSEDILPASQTNNEAFIQAGSGIYMRLEIPHIKSFNALEQNGTAISASLKFHPNINSYETNVNADSLAIFVVDNKNRYVKQLTALDGSISFARIQTENNEFGSNHYYTADISSFFEEIQTSTFDLDYSLLFQFPSNNNSVNKIKIYDDTQSENKMKIDLTYLLY